MIALGPVPQLLLRQKELELLVIKGKKDPLFHTDHHSADIQVDADHYSYEYREDVKGIIYDWIRRVIKKSRVELLCMQCSLVCYFRLEL